MTSDGQREFFSNWSLESYLLLLSPASRWCRITTWKDWDDRRRLKDAGGSRFDERQ